MVNTEQTRQMCNIVLSYMVIAVISFMTVFCWQSVDSTEIPIITRDTYDLVRFPECGEHGSENIECDEVKIWSISTGEKRTCTCQCKRGYVTYRDPYVALETSYVYEPTRKGCVWYANYDEGCDVLQSVHQVVGGGSKFPKPIIIDLTQPGSIVLKKKNLDPRPLNGITITPYVRTPGKNQWENMTDISFDLTFMNKTEDLELFKLQWSPKSNNIYAYQGLLMRLDLRQVNQDQMRGNCVMTKIAGTFTGAKSCQRQTVDGRCCIFPFVYENTLYNDCATTDDMIGSWCAVGLNTNVTEGNHKWREKCADSITLPTTSPSPATTKPLQQITTNTLPTASSQLPKSTAKTSAQQMTLEPTTNQIKPASVFSTATASQPHKSSTTPKVQSPADSRGDSDSNTTTIIAIVVSLVVFLVALLILVIVYLRRRRTSAKSVARKTASSQVLTDENLYATSGENSPPRTHQLTNVVYQESMEMSHDGPSAITVAHPKSSTGHSSSLYDNPDDVRPEVQTDAVYNMPEADYSLITTPVKQQKANARALGPPDDTSNHVYSVLERENDPLKRPEPIDNDQVFVESNPLYGTSDDVPCTTENEPDKYPPNKTGEIYNEPSEIIPSKNVYDTPEGTV